MKLAAIGIVAKDLSQSISFYRKLGLDFPDAKPGEDHIEATTAGGLRVMLDSLELARKLDPNWQKPVGQRMSLAFECESPNHVDGLCQELKNAGHEIEKEPWDAFWGQRYALVFDPDGNSVNLFAPL